MSTRLALFICVMFFSKAIYAQFKKGTRMPGMTIGSVFFNSGTSDITYPSPTSGISSRTTSFGATVSPSMGWFMSDRTVVGISININPLSTRVTYEGSNGNTFQKDEASTFNIGVGAFGRSYFNTSSSFMPFGQFGFNLGISTRNTEGYYYAPANAYKETYDGKSSGGFFANSTLSLGMTKLISPHTGIDIYAGYNFSYSKNTFKTTTMRDDGNDGSVDVTSASEPTTKFTGHGFVIGIGFQVFLEPGK